MDRKLLLAGLIALGCVVGLLLWRTGPSAVESAAAPDARAAAPQREVPAAPVLAPAPESSRAEPAQAQEPPIELLPGPSLASLAHPYPFELECTVLDDDQLPVGGSTIYLAPELGTFNRAGDTDADGKLHLDWRGRAPAMSVAICAHSPSHGWTSLFRVPLRTGAATRVSLGAAGSSPSVQVVTGDLAFVVQGIALEGCAKSASLENSPGFRDGLHPGVRFVCAPIPQPQPEPPEATAMEPLPAEFAITDIPNAALARIVFERSELDFSALRLQITLDSRLLVLQPSAELGTLAGRIVDDAEAPIVGAFVGICRDDSRFGDTPHFERTTRTGEDGTYSFEQLPSGPLLVRAGGGAQGRAQAFLELPESTTTHWSARLDRGRVVRGRAQVPAESAPAAGWRVTARSQPGDPPWWNAALTDGEGRFEVPNCPGQVLTVELFRPGAQFPVRSFTVSSRGVAGDELGIPLAAEDLLGGSLQWQLADLDVPALEEADVRIWQLASGMGTRFQVRPDGVCALGELPAGAYRIEIGVAARGWVALENVWVEAGRTSDLGSIRWPKPGRLLTSTEELEAWAGQGLHYALYRRSGDVDRLVEAFERTPPSAFTLPPDTYLLVAGGEHVAARAFPFEVRTAADTVLGLEVERVGTTTFRFQCADESPLQGPIALRLEDPTTGAPIFATNIELEARRSWNFPLVLEPGRVRLVAGDAANRRAELELEIEAGKSSPVEVVLRPN
jgi:hypothetical protein